MVIYFEYEDGHTRYSPRCQSAVAQTSWGAVLLILSNLPHTSAIGAVSSGELLRTKRSDGHRCACLLCFPDGLVFVQAAPRGKHRRKHGGRPPRDSPRAGRGACVGLARGELTAREQGHLVPPGGQSVSDFISFRRRSEGSLGQLRAWFTLSFFSVYLSHLFPCSC